MEFTTINHFPVKNALLPKIASATAVLMVSALARSMMNNVKLIKTVALAYTAALPPRLVSHKSTWEACATRTSNVLTGLFVRNRFV